MTSRIEESLTEAESYITAANKQYEKALENDLRNPINVNCIMTMIKSVNALILEQKAKQQKTTQELPES